MLRQYFQHFIIRIFLTTSLSTGSTARPTGPSPWTLWTAVRGRRGRPRGRSTGTARGTPRYPPPPSTGTGQPGTSSGLADREIQNYIEIFNKLTEEYCNMHCTLHIKICKTVKIPDIFKELFSRCFMFKCSKF